MDILNSKECSLFVCEERKHNFCCDYCYKNSNCENRCKNKSSDCGMLTDYKNSTELEKIHSAYKFIHRILQTCEIRNKQDCRYIEILLDEREKYVRQLHDESEDSND